jgi:transposase InsO family protein
MGRAKKTQDQTLSKVYYTPKHAASYGGVRAVERVVKGGKQKKKVKPWLDEQDTYTLHKPVRYRFPRRRVIVGGLDHQWQADLVDVARLSKDNKGIKFLLTCIDVLSKYAWVVPLKDKTGKSLVAAFETIFKTGRQPLALQTDKGTEFLNRPFQKFLKDHNVSFFTTENEDIKASIAERFNRTIKTKMWKYFTRHDTLVYHNILSDLVWSYNHTYHRSIKTQPASVNTKNQEVIWQRLYAHDRPVPSFKFRVGDHVRISKARRTFKKGYLPNWTREIFTVTECRFGDPPVYVLQDDGGTLLQGTFYAEELQKVTITKDKLYKIEAILDEQKKGKRVQYLVKWEGYPTSFNSWLDKAELRKYKG